MRCEVARSQTLRRKEKLQEKLDELERRKAFLQGRREHLLSVNSEFPRQEEEEGGGGGGGLPYNKNKKINNKYRFFSSPEKI